MKLSKYEFYVNDLLSLDRRFIVVAAHIPEDDKSYKKLDPKHDCKKIVH